MKRFLNILMGLLLISSMLFTVTPVRAEEAVPPTDTCPDDPLKSEPGVCGCGVVDEDSDGDGVMDCLDVCAGAVDVDSDGDGTMDCLDTCSLDPLKSEPGTCGCGVVDVDTDDDGVFDCSDTCPADPLKSEPGICGCGIVDSSDDVDEDGVPDCLDVCPGKVDKQIDTDKDGIIDCADKCPDGFECKVPEAPDTWVDGKSIVINLGGNSVDTTFTVSGSPTVYENECADPNVYINYGNNNETVTSPDDPWILERFNGINGITGIQRIDWLKIGVNVATNQSWTDASEKDIYWNLLGYSKPISDPDLVKANEVKSGVFDSILQQVSIWFLKPANPAATQLTFTKVCADKVPGCTDPTAFNYDPLANYDDNSCEPVVTGCMDDSMLNFNPAANTPGECTPIITGCMTPGMKNYNSSANTPGACTPVVTGCLDESMLNYNPLANTSGSCIDGSQISMALDPYCMGGDIFWQIDNTNSFPVEVAWSLTTKGSGSSTLAGNGVLVLGTTPDAPGSYTLTVSWKGGSSSLTSSLECDPVTTTTSFNPPTETETELVIPVTGAELPLVGEFSLQLGALALGLSLVIKGLKKQD